jgi:hypothetical protein
MSKTAVDEVARWLPLITFWVGLLCVLARVAVSQASIGPIHFAFHPIDFTLDSCETPQRHAPETMAGGVAAFDHNDDGKLDIFFTNGADISTLKKNSPKYWNRLFRNNGDGTFTDVTAKAGVAGTALKGVILDKRTLHWVQRVASAKSLNCHHPGAIDGG